MPPFALELYDSYGRQYQPGFRNLRFAKTLYGGEDSWMVFVLDRSSGLDYPDVAYGNDVILRKGLVPVFAGEIRNIEQDSRSCIVKALGNWVYLDDYSYGNRGKLWVDTRYENLDPVTSDMVARCSADRYQMDNQDRLYIAPRRGEFIGGGMIKGAAAYYYVCRFQNIERVTFTYAMAEDNWRGTGLYYLQASLYSCLENFGGQVQEWTVGGGGVPAVPPGGNVDRTLAPNARPVIFFELLDTHAIEEWLDDTGDAFLKITNLKIWGDATDITPTSSDVAGDIVDEMVAAGTPISTDKSLIQPIGLVFTPLVFEHGETCHEALKTVAFYGDAQHKLLGWGVEGGGNRVFIRKPDYASVRYVVHPNDAKRILLRGTTHGDYLTEGWGKYRDEEGQIQYTVKYYAHVTPGGIVANVTSTGDDLASTVFGVKRSAPVDFGPMQAAMAADAIQQYLIERAHPLITSNIEIFHSVKDLHKGGVEIHPAEMETGYLVQIPHFRAVEVAGGAGSDIRDFATTFLLEGYQYDDERGSTRLFPEEPEWDLTRLSRTVKDMAREMEIL